MTISALADRAARRRTVRTALPVVALILVGLVLSGAPALAADRGYLHTLGRMNPLPAIKNAGRTVAGWPKTVRTNWKEGRFYATDLTEHPTWQAALKRSMMPVDMSANVKAAFLGKVHPVKLVGNLADPLGIELGRQIASGEGLDFGRLVKSLHPAVVAGTFAGGLAGDVAGAALQSLLAKAGPVGAAAGFFLRPTVAFGAQVFGFNVGQGVAKGMTFRSSLAQGLRDIRPGRDFGQLMGGTLGSLFGQVLIPIPVVGGIIGGMIGGTLGALIGSKLGQVGLTGTLERSVMGLLGRWADAIEGKSRPDPAARVPPERSVEPGGGRDPPSPSASLTPGPGAPPRPRPAGPPASPDSGPGMDDLPIATP
ncbi:MAG: hypothetical protein HY815_13270 [Candidatus Riflebacteria bacterium]|nr:hypothetical protein [Candidatus Riflebacteria bacterium]